MLLKNKVFFNEGDGVKYSVPLTNQFFTAFSYKLQPSTQKRINHATLTAEYPRYPDIFNVTISETEKNMLMVCLKELKQSI